MKYALINPNWNFEGSIYFGCREPHLPVEYGYARLLLEEEGHEAEIVDGHLENLDTEQIKDRVRAFRPDFLVLTTAPTYLFWRCPPPELRIPMQLSAALRDTGITMMIVGPHGSVTPEIVLRKTGADMVITGEFETVLPKICEKDRSRWEEIPSVCYFDGDGFQRTEGAGEPDLAHFPAIRWPSGMLRLHAHHHHRFDSPGIRHSPGAEIESSRGCPFMCSFCAREKFRGTYRKRPLHVVLEELDGLSGQGADYVYFIDEIFFPDRRLLQALKARRIPFGIQTRIDLWNSEMLNLLGEAGCVSIEAGIESISIDGRLALRRFSNLSSRALAEKLIHARKKVPFVQATLLDGRLDDPAEVRAWRAYLHDFGVWANNPVPLFPYPGSWEYSRRWGAPDDKAWERAHMYYLESNSAFSDIQDQQPLSLPELERTPGRYAL